MTMDKEDKSRPAVEAKNNRMRTIPIVDEERSEDDLPGIDYVTFGVDKEGRPTAKRFPK